MKTEYLAGITLSNVLLREQQIALGTDRNNQRIMNLIQQKEKHSKKCTEINANL
jgi:hypothetical protein